MDVCGKVRQIRNTEIWRTTVSDKTRDNGESEDVAYSQIVRRSE
jgi:hypothetical protein